MSDLRRRKRSLTPATEEENKSQEKSGDVLAVGNTSRSSSTAALNFLNILFGVVVAIIVGVKYALYARQIHENDMWFSNIGQIEREISFRTESGLYFNYYKNFVLAPSVSKGFYDLMHDNKTEHLRTINILERFNVYQEVILGVLYKTLPLPNSLQYVYFYINSIFGLHAMYMIALYASAWMMSGSWLAGLLAPCFFIFNRSDTTRLSFTIPLRESFGFPFLFTQMTFVTCYLKKHLSPATQKALLVCITICTFLFALVWQFAQFVLLLQCFAFFGVCVLELVPKHKIRNMYVIVAVSLLSVCILQFMNDMILCSLALSFSLAALIVLSFQSDQPTRCGVTVKLVGIVIRSFSVLALMVGISFVIKTIMKVESDEHIFKFVKSKLGYNVGRDFDTLLYLCEESFQVLPVNTYERLTRGVVFPCYVTSVVVLLGVLTYTLIHNWRRDVKEREIEGPPDGLALNEQPELAYHVIQTVLFAVMACSTLRFKFLWTPHMCLVAAGVFCHQGFWRMVFGKCAVKGSAGRIIAQGVPIILISVLLWSRLATMRTELEQLREFYDPDTVQLMHWIREKTPSNASFTGSMQLLAAVKLSTDRPITNHPHYENKFLRERTRQVYQIYGRRTPREVSEILKRHGTNYIILENSICYSRGPPGCRLPDIIDLDNGHVLEDGQSEHGLKPTNVPRFCDAIKYQKVFRPYFKKVFENRTFYIYKVR